MRETRSRRTERMGRATRTGADEPIRRPRGNRVGRIPHGLDRRVLEGSSHAGSVRGQSFRCSFECFILSLLCLLHALTASLCCVTLRQYPCKTWDEAYCRGPGIQLFKPGGGALCSWRAHFTCPNFDTNYHDLCGYFLTAGTYTLAAYTSDSRSSLLSSCDIAFFPA